MLHEILLVLAGNASPIISEKPTALSESLLHPSETALIASIAEFGHLHRTVRAKINVVHGSYMDLPSEQMARFASNYYSGPYSAACHAIANVLDQQLLVPFNAKLVELEKQALKTSSSKADSSLDCSLSVIPLTSLVSQTIHVWQGRFNYANELLGFLMEKRVFCHEILAKLPLDLKTGFLDRKELANQCLTAAEKVWLTLLVSWVFYGEPGKREFFINVNLDRHTGEKFYSLADDRIPPFLSRQTAELIYSTGESMAYLMRDSFHQSTSHKSFDAHTTLTTSLHSSSEFTDKVEHPLRDDQLSLLIQSAQGAVYERIASCMMPISDVEHYLHVIRSIVLAGSDFFLESFLEEIRRANAAIGHSTTFSLSKPFINSVGIFAEDGTQTDNDCHDMATKLLSYTNNHTSHNDDRELLMQSLRGLIGPTSQALCVNAQWPFNIVVTRDQQGIYSDIFTVLVVMKLESDRIISLWRDLRTARHPALASPHREQEQIGNLWSIASQAKFFFDIIWNYMQSSVIDKAMSSMLAIVYQQKAIGQVNPQQLASEHHKLVDSLSTGLFLDNGPILKLLHSICLNCSKLVNVIEGRSHFIAELPILSLINEFYDQLESQASVNRDINQLLVNLATMRTL